MNRLPALPALPALYPRRSHFHNSRSASALLIVLGMIALISVVVLAFFSAATTERAAVHNQASAEAARNLAGNALQLVMAKIADGTKGGTATAPLAWASQPGMIRTYDTSGNPARYYKLYSSGTLTVDNPAGLNLAALLADDAPPTNWKASPGVWSDLNSPMADSTGRLNYPILDPTFQDPDPALRTGTNVSPEGFSISAGTLGYTSSQPASAGNNPAPMPVKWLYQLKDGTLVSGSAAGSGGSAGGAVTVAGATAVNPIVGRIAFWTDDETCKVNINTAAEGTFWDTPRFKPSQINTGIVMQGNPFLPVQSMAWQYPDVAFACYQPARYEFQRYPGHPAQVALSSVFPALSATNAIVNGVANPDAIASIKEIATRLTPKLAWEGSTKAGTVWAGTSTVDLTQAARKAPYATLDEFQFSGTATAASGTSLRQPNSLGTASITKTDLEAAKFFCTANGRSPEVNLFNQPRIACWPVDASLASGSSSYLNRTTAYDRLIAFCSTLRRDLGFVGGNSQRYFFQRADAQSPTNDYTNIDRNQKLYAYLQRLTSAPVPGFGGNFLSKYGPDRDQILTEIFDYIRCTNLVDPNLAGFPIPTAAVDGKPWPRLTNQFAPAIRTPSSDNGSNNLLGLGQAMPIRIGNTVGFGRFASLKEIAFLFVCVGDGALPSVIYGNGTIRDSQTLDNYISTLDAYIQFVTDPATDFLTAQAKDLAISTMASNIPASGINGIPVSASAVPNVSSYLAANPAEWTRLRQKWGAAISALVTKQRAADSTYPGYNLALESTPLLPAEKRIQMLVLFRLNVPAAGLLQFIPDLLFRIKGLEAVRATNAYNIGPAGGTGPFFSLPANCTDWFHKTKQPWVRAYSLPLYFDSLIGGNNYYSGLRPPWYSTTLSNPTNNTSRPYYPFVSRGFTVNSPLSFSGADLTFELYEGKNIYDPKNNELGVKFKDPAAPPLSSVLDHAECLHQTAQINFAPEFNIPLPTLDTGLNWSKYNRYKIETHVGAPENGGMSVLFSTDKIRSMCFKDDGRLGAVMTNIPSSMFVAYPLLTGTKRDGRHQLDYYTNGWSSYPIGGTGTPTLASETPPGTAVTTGDFDLACGVAPGGYINKPDEGDNSRGTANGSGTGAAPPYYFYAQDSSNSVLYTPNRIMPSPGMFGSLLTRAKAGIGWQTLLFRPQPSHPSYAGTAYPMTPDHLMMDLFWMPIVEPYAISETFSTAGKVNMNYQILPFTYINRPTALKAAMKVEMGTAVPNGNGSTFTFSTAPGLGDPITGGSTWRKNLNLSETNGSLRQFREKFAAGEIFRSASQICDIYLVPRDQSWTSDSAAQTFWNSNRNTPDNMREKPYTNLYARLTTKSNTFTVHVRAQAVQKAPGSPANQWIEGRDKVIAEERSSTVIERYLDSEDSSLIDFATDSSRLLSDFYRMRVLSTKRFAP